MKIRSLTVKNVRTHNQMSIELSDTITLLTGANGSGKTTLLEAIYISLRGKSFKDSDDAVLQKDKKWYRIDMITTQGDRTTVFDVRTDRKKKTHIINGKQYLRLPPNVKYPVVLFEPQDMQLLTGSPSRRRRYMDVAISQYDGQYASALYRYDRALQQRNKLLKRQHCAPDELFVWNVALSRYGAEIVTARQDFITELQEQVQAVCNTIAPTGDDVVIRYSHSTHLTSQRILNDLEYNYERDRAMGTTSTGPHRHDFEVLFNGRSAASTGSRGELRTITLAIKFIEASLLRRRTQQRPLILLDDVFSELDVSRQARLLNEFREDQIIMTSVNHLPLSADDHAPIQELLIG